MCCRKKTYKSVNIKKQVAWTRWKYIGQLMWFKSYHFFSDENEVFIGKKKPRTCICVVETRKENIVSSGLGARVSLLIWGCSYLLKWLGTLKIANCNINAEKILKNPWYDLWAVVAQHLPHNGFINASRYVPHYDIKKNIRGILLPVHTPVANSTENRFFAAKMQMQI